MRKSGGEKLVFVFWFCSREREKKRRETEVGVVGIVRDMVSSGGKVRKRTGLFGVPEVKLRNEFLSML